jgi:hypothetical protein
MVLIMARIDFDSNQVPDMTQTILVPNGDYVAVMVRSELRETRAMDGKYLECVFRIIEGPYSGRHQTARLITEHDSKPFAVEMGKGKLKRFCCAVGKPLVQDSDELENLPLIICVEQRKQRDSDRVNNEIVDYKPCPDQRPPVASGVNLPLKPVNFPQYGSRSRS